MLGDEPPEAGDPLGDSDRSQRGPVGRDVDADERPAVFTLDRIGDRRDRQRGADVHERIDAGRRERIERGVDALERDPPAGARIDFSASAAGGWNAPGLAPWLARSLESASQACYGLPFLCMGEGGSIPFMGMLGAAFPQAQFMITGVLGPQSNAHGPNEFLHIPFARGLTACVARVLYDHARHAKQTP